MERIIKDDPRVSAVLCLFFDELSKFQNFCDADMKLRMNDPFGSYAERFSEVLISGAFRSDCS
jgi:hypothetical protein